MGQFTVQAEGKVGQFGGYVGEGGMLMELGILPGYVQGAGDMIAQTRQQEEVTLPFSWSFSGLSLQSINCTMFLLATGPWHKLCPLRREFLLSFFSFPYLPSTHPSDFRSEATFL